MGILNNDVYTCSNGTQKAGTYISFAFETLYVSQIASNTMGSFPAPVAPNMYMVRANYRIYWDQECRDMGKTFIDLQSVSTQLTQEQLNENIYSVLYNVLKTIYPNFGDVRSAPKSTNAVCATGPSGSSDASSATGPSGPSGSSDVSGPSGSSDASSATGVTGTQ
jgi:hypothetical protein